MPSDTEPPEPIALEDRMSEQDRLYSPSAARNVEAIVAAWGDLLAPSGRVLEIAAGTGEHGVGVCRTFPGLTWQPSDPDEASRRSQAAWALAAPECEIHQPLDLDVCADHWWSEAKGAYDTIFCANMIHIAPWAAAEGLFRGAGAIFARRASGPEPAGTLALYGPFARRGISCESNSRFDRSLKSRDPAWGVRDLDDAVQPLAARHGLRLTQVRTMPANNLFVLFVPN